MPNSRRNGRRRGPPRRGYTGRGFGPACRVLVPLKGPHKREFFNALSRWAVASAGLAGTALGYGAAGPLGAALGLALSLTGAARYVIRNRFYRR